MFVTMLLTPPFVLVGVEGFLLCLEGSPTHVCGTQTQVPVVSRFDHFRHKLREGPVVNRWLFSGSRLFREPIGFTELKNCTTDVPRDVDRIWVTSFCQGTIGMGPKRLETNYSCDKGFTDG